MSLDVSLRMPRAQQQTEDASAPRVFIREDGQTKAITRQEWDQRFPGREPVVVLPLPDDAEDTYVYTANITHNLTRMADAAGIYQALWRPEEVGITTAVQLIEPLRQGLQRLRDDPTHFAVFNPANGWGTYDTLLRFVEAYIAACETYPTAEVSVSR